MKIEKDKYARFCFSFRNSEGDIVYETAEEDASWYIHGRGLIMPAMEKAMEGHEEGENFIFAIPQDEAFGPRREALVREFRKDEMPEGFEAEIGAVLEVTDEDGNVFPAFVCEVGEEILKLDANHPLAGQDLNCEMKVLEVRDATMEEWNELERHLMDPEQGPVMMEFGEDAEGGCGCHACHTGTCGDPGCSDHGKGNGSKKPN